MIADRVVDLIYLKYLKAKITYENDVRVETYPFAREAVREAVYNALIHCKWEDGIPIQIRIEDKNMYISNACVFPNDWTTENLMRIHNSRPYNPDLAGTFYVPDISKHGDVEFKKFVKHVKNWEHQCLSIF